MQRTVVTDTAAVAVKAVADVKGRNILNMSMRAAKYFIRQNAVK